MLLYHGTTLTNSISIHHDKTLRCKIERYYNNEEFPTTDGYVYLSNRINHAIYYGNKNSVYSDEEYFAVYEIDICYDNLKIDIDELKYVAKLNDEEIKTFSVDSCLELVSSCRIDRDLTFGVDVKRYAVLPTTMNYKHELCDIAYEIISDRENRDVDYLSEIRLKLPWVDI
ncbi:hypothetical protein [Paenibacillus sp. 481]|uniref:hypothetical protein n=1 Tax=Paenibacillus sp. 481 TaxID=2835869 RepID=UPI001E3EBC17|nr:hypothetical protein [Paenibacillus sp. 481]UHA72054.1 hypothetical protein KIK04_15210 [Paenibacillus sp. 481]